MLFLLPTQPTKFLWFKSVFFFFFFSIPSHLLIQCGVVGCYIEDVLKKSANISPEHHWKEGYIWIHVVSTKIGKNSIMWWATKGNQKNEKKYNEHGKKQKNMKKHRDNQISSGRFKTGNQTDNSAKFIYMVLLVFIFSSFLSLVYCLRFIFYFCHTNHTLFSLSLHSIFYFFSRPEHTVFLFLSHFFFQFCSFCVLK